MAEHRLISPADPDVNAYHYLTALVVPRPIAWVATRSADGIGNLAPHSFFTVASARPPIVQFTSVGVKDTLRNIEATGEFTISLASEPQLDLINQSSAPYDDRVDEAEALGIDMVAGVEVATKRVAAAPAALECRLHSTLPIGDSTVVFGEVVAISLDPDVLVSERPAIAKLRPLSRLGGSEWGLPPEVIRVTRPTDV